MSDERVTVELTDAEVGVRRESSDFEERAAFAAFNKAGEGNYRLHDIEPIEGGVRVHLRRVEEKQNPEWVEETFEDEEVGPDDAVCGCDDCNTTDRSQMGSDPNGFLTDEEYAAMQDGGDATEDEELTPEQISPVLGLSVDDDRTVTLNAGDISALIEVLEFAGNILPRIEKFPYEGRSLPVSIDRLRLRLGVSRFMGYSIGVFPDGTPYQMMVVMPDFKDTCLQWLEKARAEYDRQHPQKKIVEVHSGDAGLRVEE